MKKVLFVGENPLGTTGNSNMLAAMLNRLDMDKYTPACLVTGNVDPSPILFDSLPYTMVDAATPEDHWGNRRLISLIQSTDFDYLCMVGVDFWRYTQAWNAIRNLRDAKKFKWISIFPYDLWTIRPSWVKYLNALDYPCVYSKYGYEALKPYVPHVRYYRPELNDWGVFTPTKNKRAEVFPSIPDDKVIFGFVGINQIRKSPELLVKAFFEAKRKVPNIVLYLHTEMEHLYNLKQIAQDCGAKDGDLISKQQGVSYARGKMPTVYNAMDCVINCSMQEGLSWTPIEAMACGVPVIASETTAQTELVQGAGRLVPCNDTSFVPMTGEFGPVTIESRACNSSDIAQAIVEVAENKALRESMSAKGLQRAKEWFGGMGDINALLSDAGKKVKPPRKIPAILFAQHSSAGDVLMTTQCFKGIKERHPDMPLIYMTQKVFAGVVFGNPYLDEIIEWDERLIKQYEVVYNPHGEHIHQGGFNNLDVTLYSMYPYFTNVEADELFIAPTAPAIKLPEDYIVVHTTGGSKKYRSYPHMDMVLKDIGLAVVQLGGPDDIRCKSDLDLCGKLTWQESAWIMQHAKKAVVIDSFLSHLAGAVGTDAVVLYGPAPPRVVQPRVQGCEIINLKPDMLKVCRSMTHCWSTSRQCESPCIHTINPMDIRKALEGLLK
jgi:ADP-heptose:LPS heptosyltransferase/glycosyltransferase involved in cell wall biosynthesis